MKNLNRNSFLILLASTLMTGSLSFAEKMNTKTQDLVIKKMERVISIMDSRDTSWLSSKQRLADLLSERARNRFMLEIETNCQGCKGSVADREKATEIYEILLKTVDLKQDGKILFQLAHLYQMAGNNEKAQSLFESILKNAKTQKTSRIILTRTHAGLGDLLFQKGNFKEAHKNYSAALQDKELMNRPLVIYNKAWCEFNMEQVNRAIATLFALLSHPEQITRQNEEGQVYDAAFHTDLLKDLATFYAKKTVTAQEINSFENLIPKGNEKEMLMHFATEVDRIGQKRAAQIILDKYLLDKTLTKQERLLGFIMRAQVSYDNGQSAQSIQDFAKAAAAYQDQGCSKSEDCVKLQKTMKYYVTELHRSKKLKPDADLLNSYSIYVKTFPEDKEMITRAAQTAMEVGHFGVAVQYYRKISTNSEFSEKERNEALLNEVSAAEKSNNPQIKKDSYVYFIKHSSDDVKVYEVKYQLAYLAYSQKQFREAADSFYSLAKEKKGKLELRKKAADLSLDSLAQLKTDSELESRAWEYAKIFPAATKEFETLARKALMNQVAIVANDKNSGSAEYRKFLNKTWEAKLTTATPEEKILFYSNARVLSLKLDDQESYLKAQQLLLAQPTLSEDKKQEIYSSLTAFYEKRLDFKQAYKWALKINNAKTQAKENEFRLGTLADLALLNPERHYRAALKAGLSDGKSLVVRSRLIALSSNPVAELKKQAPELKRQPQLFNDMVLLVYARTGNGKALSSLLATKELRSRSAARFLTNQTVYDRILQHRRKLTASQMNSYSPKALQRDTTERAKLLSQADSLLKESLQLKDITAQMMSLDMIAIENNRFFKDLSQIPQPKGLTIVQEAQYTRILDSKIRPYMTKASLAEQKRQEIWAQSNALVELINDYTQARPEIQKLMSRQVTLLSQVSGDGPLKYNLQTALSASSISPKELASARRSVSENPEDAKQIENLKKLETKMGHPLMPAYLGARLNHLQKEKSL